SCSKEPAAWAASRPADSKTTPASEADLLGGAKFEYTTYNDKGTYFDNRPVTPSTSPYDYSSTYTNTLLSIGPSLRYRVVSHLEGVKDFFVEEGHAAPAATAAARPLPAAPAPALADLGPGQAQPEQRHLDHIAQLLAGDGRDFHAFTKM
nr:hypothetical protein [Tanacetum cinerariifolium]